MTRFDVRFEVSFKLPLGVIRQTEVASFLLSVSSCIHHSNKCYSITTAAIPLELPRELQTAIAARSASLLHSVSILCRVNGTRISLTTQNIVQKQIRHCLHKSTWDEKRCGNRGSSSAVDISFGTSVCYGCLDWKWEGEGMGDSKIFHDRHSYAAPAQEASSHLYHTHRIASEVDSCPLYSL